MTDIEQSLDRIKLYRKTINKRKAKKQSVLATESGRTYHELIMEEFFKILGIDIELDSFFCFNCNHSFNYSGNGTGFPSYCPICNITYKKEEPGQFSRPDIILREKAITVGGKMYERKDQPFHYLIVYVNGIMHCKTKFQNKDYHQIKHLLDNNVKVMVIENEIIEDSGNDILTAFCKLCRDCLTDSRLYTIYRYSSDALNRILTR